MSSLICTRPEMNALILGWRTPLIRDNSDWVVPVSNITHGAARHEETSLT
jgi:hypothetical protein